MVQEIEKMLFSYGFLPLLVALNHYEELEQYEVCGYILKGLNLVQRRFDLEIPKRYNKDAVADMKQAFNKLGYSGDIALKNTPFYAKEIIDKLNNLIHKKEMTLQEEAQAMVNVIYQPTGYIKHNENSKTMWKWASERAIEMIEKFIEKMPEGSANWLHHRKLVDEINKNKE